MPASDFGVEGYFGIGGLFQLDALRVEKMGDEFEKRVLNFECVCVCVFEDTILSIEEDDERR